MSAAEPEPEENNDGAFHVSYPRAPPLVSQSSEVVPGMRQDDIKAAFKIFDKDGDGTISSSELLAILTRGNTGILSLEDAKAILKDFDANGDGVLSISEFTKALASDFGDAVRNSEVYTTDLYNRRIEPHLAAIKALFDRLDLDKSGFLSCDEMKDVVSFYEGDVFDAATFLEWYDTNHREHLANLLPEEGAKFSKADGKLDVTEFGWYIASSANCEPKQMAPTIKAFTEAVEYIEMKRGQK